jgi:hypothetical protein
MTRMFATIDGLVTNALFGTADCRSLSPKVTKNRQTGNQPQCPPAGVLKFLQQQSNRTAIVVSYLAYSLTALPLLHPNHLPPQHAIGGVGLVQRFAPVRP